MNDTIETINCPACGKPMQKVYITNTGFYLDICTDGCGGIFFDNKELKHFDEYHENIDEIMYVIKGTGIVKDEDGEYPYNPGDTFMYPANVFHEIYNNGDIESEYIFVRIHNDKNN